MNWDRFVMVERAIDDRFLEEAQAPMTNRSVLYRTLAFAACFCLVLGGVGLAGGNLYRKAETPRKMTAAGSTSFAYNGEAEEAKEAPAVAFAMAVPESTMDAVCTMEEAAMEESAEADYMMFNMVNPITEVTSEELITQGYFALPEDGGELISCCLISGFDSPIAEIQFTRDGIEYTLRQIFCEAAMDISGIYDDYSEQEVALNNNSASLKVGTEYARVEQYLDSLHLQLCLSAGNDSADALIALAGELFPNTNGQ